MKSSVKAVLQALLSSKLNFYSGGNSQVEVTEAADAPGERVMTAWGLEVLRVSQQGENLTLKYQGYSGRHQPAESVSLVGEVFQELCKGVLPQFEATLQADQTHRPKALSLTKEGEELMNFKESVPLDALQKSLA